MTIFVAGNIPHPLPPEDLLTTGDRDALASWFVAQKGINYSFQVIEDFLNDRARIPQSPNSEPAPNIHSKGASPHYAAESSPLAHPRTNRTLPDGARPGGRKARKPSGTLQARADVHPIG